MNCADSSHLVHAYADGELELAKNLELDRHFETCAVCARQKESILSLKSALRGANLRFDAPASLRRKVRRMAHRSDREIKRRFLSPLLLWKTWAFGATGLALALMLLRPGISEQEHLSSEAVASHVRSLMAEHLTDVASSDQHTVKPWFNGKLDFAPDVKDFAAQGFPLVGGRLDYLKGRTVAALVYRRNQHFINVFIWPGTNGGRGKLAVENRRGYFIINHEAHGLRHCLVSDLNAEELAQFAKLFEQ